MIIIGAFYYLRVVKLMYFDAAEAPAPLAVGADGPARRAQREQPRRARPGAFPRRAAHGVLDGAGLTPRQICRGRLRAGANLTSHHITMQHHAQRV
jgi:hypothetical protein